MARKKKVEETVTEEIVEEVIPADTLVISTLDIPEVKAVKIRQPEIKKINARITRIDH